MHSQLGQTYNSRCWFLKRGGKSKDAPQFKFISSDRWGQTDATFRPPTPHVQESVSYEEKNPGDPKHGFGRRRKKNGLFPDLRVCWFVSSRCCQPGCQRFPVPLISVLGVHKRMGASACLSKQHPLGFWCVPALILLQAYLLPPCFEGFGASHFAVCILILSSLRLLASDLQFSIFKAQGTLSWIFCSSRFFFFKKTFWSRGEFVMTSCIQAVFLAAE